MTSVPVSAFYRENAPTDYLRLCFAKRDSVLDEAVERMGAWLKGCAGRRPERRFGKMAIQALVWGENVHERENAVVREIYADGMHNVIAAALREDAGIEADTATLQEPEHGLAEARLARTDVLLWWGHKAHGDVADSVVERVANRVWEGMGLIVLHSGHFSKIFKRVMGTPCSLKWREAGERERVWVINRGHPIAAGLGECVEIPSTEMYGEPFTVPEPQETVFISWYEGGEVFRSGMTWRRGGRQRLLFRARPRDLSDLSPEGGAAGAAERRALGAQSGAALERHRERPERAGRQGAGEDREPRPAPACRRRGGLPVNEAWCALPHAGGASW